MFSSIDSSLNIMNDFFSLKGKHVLVTGATSGIGQCIALECAEMGARVSIVGRNAERLAKTFSELASSGQSMISADLTNESELEKLVENIIPINGLVHSAGISQLVPFRMTRYKHINETFASNTVAPLLLTQKLVSARKILPKASIVFISAVASHAGPIASSAYSASKSALLGASRSIAQDLSKQEIRVNCIAPGYVQTPMLESLSKGGGTMEERSHWAPLGIGMPEDVAYATVFHLSDASRSINRSYFMVDGGISIGLNI
jgi:NAD(P)-dependent dehydrogenase (short-subunit alcohol dehydrogenase family)